MLKKYLSDQRGITLVELLAVVVILGIVSTIAIISIGNVIQNSREDAARADAIQILNAAELYVATNDLYISEIITRTELDDFLTREGSFAEPVNWIITRNPAGELTISAQVPVGSRHMQFFFATVSAINESRGELVIRGPL